jgi:hypothetical protein
MYKYKATLLIHKLYLNFKTPLLLIQHSSIWPHSNNLGHLFKALRAFCSNAKEIIHHPFPPLQADGRKKSEMRRQWQKRVSCEEGRKDETALKSDYSARAATNCTTNWKGCVWWHCQWKLHTYSKRITKFVSRLPSLLQPLVCHPEILG